MVFYFCYSSSLNVCVAYSFLFWIAIWPLSSSLDLKGEAGAWHLKELQAKKKKKTLH